jgi:hypothetical protein
MGEASRRKRNNKDIKLSDSSSFFDYLLSPKSENDLLPLTDELIEKLVNEMKIPKDDLVQMAADGFLYSTTRNSFILPDMG